MLRVKLLVLLLAVTGTSAAQVTLSRGTNFSVDVASDGQIAMDLLGKIWIVPAAGGQAQTITDGSLPARRPRWSPDEQAIVFQACAGNQEQLWLYRFEDLAASNISDGQFFDHHPAWHPDGDRIVYSSDRKESGFDLWELDLATGLTWRISSLDGDETEPAWSSDGHDLVFIHRNDSSWSLMLRRHGQPDQVLETSATRLYAPSWRPDGSLISFLRQHDGGLSIDMIILSDPPLIRPLITDEDFFVAPIAWLDRQQMLYPANGLIRARLFNSWTSRTIPFRATVARKTTPQRAAIRQRELPVIDEPVGQLVIRSARLFDGIGGGYREGLDIVIQGSRIRAVEAARDRPEAITIDMGDLTVLPGLVDGQASLPGELDASLGPVLLAFGITTIVADHVRADELNQRWSGTDMPGPRVLGSGWQLDLDLISTAMRGAESLPLSPRGIRYEDAQLSSGADAKSMLSGLADARTLGLAALLRSRQAGLLRGFPTAIRRFTEKPRLEAQSSAIVLGSSANGFAPGIALHAEFRALSEAGMDQEHVLRSAGINVASALGLGVQLGRIAPGSSADLVLIDGDPLNDLSDALKVVGVVRNGRFFSTIGLLERAQQRETVE